MIIPTQVTLDIQRFVSSQIDNLIFHHLSHALLDIASTYPSENQLNYLEIGCFAGGSSCLMLQRPNTRVVSVDLGEIISPKLVIENAKKLQKQNTIFNYIKGNSHDSNTVSQVKNTISTVDMLYIDGDTSFSSITKDFNLYNSLVKIGGFIIFDDFLENKPAYTSLFNQNFETFGYLQNSFKARPDNLNASLYVIRRIS